MMPCLSLLCFMVFGPPGAALSFTPAPVVPAAASVQGYGRGGRCRAWTDGCVTCTQAGGEAHCSTPGIACTPRPIACTQPAAE